MQDNTSQHNDSFINSKVIGLVMYQSIPSLTIPPGDPWDSHILVASEVGFSLLCLARGFFRGGGGLKSK